MEAVPFPVWGEVPDPSTSDSIVAAEHIAQFRWIKVSVGMLVGARAVIPLLDNSNKPFVDPSLPPFVAAKRDEGGPVIGDQASPDLPSVGHKWRMGCVRANRDLDRFPMVHWFMRRKNDPVPHWQLEAHFGYHDTTGAVPGSRSVTLDLDFLTTDIGPYDADTPIGASAEFNARQIVGAEIGADWQAFITWDLWSGIANTDHGDSPDKSSLEEMVMGVGAHDMTGSSKDMYLTDDGTSTGVSLFDMDVRPACRIFGDPRNNLFPAGSAELRAGGAQSTWRPGTHGCGYDDPLWASPFTLDDGTQVWWTGVAPTYEDPVNFFYDAYLENEASSSRWKVRLTRANGVFGTCDRTFYVHAFGKAP
jgi:hypothetical protein